MILATGARLGAYEVLTAIGAGGMGEVYRARDTKLKREVAIKVLPEAFAQDAEWLARFRREAEVLASLNHPNIAAIYGLEEAGGIHAIVMELVEGQTLADRVKAGAVPFDEALAIARQMADALENAHEKGVVHRDLKPANVKITPEGNVKILDFGLAKLADPAEARPCSDTNSPTRTVQGTRAGIILGTAGYMSPEQARGQLVDKRADIWAFGVVFFELLVGERLFKGDGLTDVLAGVVKDPADLSQIPSKVRRLLESCLEKDPRKRLRDIGDIWRLLEEPPAPSVAANPLGRWAWGVVAVLAVVAIAGWLRTESAVSEQPSVALTIAPPTGVALTAVGSLSSAPEISPDGSAVMYRSSNGILDVRRLDSLEPRSVLGSEAAVNAAFWSADSTTIVFPAARQLMKSRLPDGAPEAIAPLLEPSRGGSWSDRGTILIAAAFELRAGPASGGELKPVEMPAFEHGSYLNPEFLPGSEDFLFVFVPFRNPDDAGVYLATLRDGKAVDLALLLKNQTAAHYTPAGGGRILFVRNDNLYSQRLNRRARKLEGDAELVVHGVASQPSSGVSRGDFSVARNGTVAWRPGKAALAQVTIFDRQGNRTGTTGPPGSFTSIALSPDEKQILAVSDRSWLMDVGQPGRLALPNGGQSWLGWSTDRSTLFGVGERGFVEMSANGTGEVRQVRQFHGFFVWTEISSDSKQILGKDNSRIVSVQLQGTPEETTPRVLVQGSDPVYQPRFSPDGRWFVYGARDSGTGINLYAQPFPGPGQRRTVAPLGRDPMWRKDGKEILYVSVGSPIGLMSVTVEAVGNDLRFGTPRTLFSGLRVPASASASDNPLAVSSDGSRIFWLQGVEQPDSNVIFIKTVWAK